MSALRGRSQPERLRTVSEVSAYADQLAEFADQVDGLNLDEQDVVTIAQMSDGSLVATINGEDLVRVFQDVA